MGMGSLEFVVFWVLGCSLGGRASMEMSHQKECEFTRYPSLCVETLMGLGLRNIQHVDIVSAFVNKTISETKQQLPTSDFAKFGVQEAKHAHSVTGYCEKLMSMSLKRLDQSLFALKDSPSYRKNKHDIQTWLSAALTFNQACKDLAESSSSISLISGDLMALISNQMDYLSQLGSIPLALVNRIAGAGEEQAFPKWVSAGDRKLLQETSIKADVIVAKDGSGNYKTISEAIQAASGKRFVIYVKSGVYKEKIRTAKDGITIIGQGKYSTIIEYSDSVAKGSSMPGSATFTITGDGFIARDIGFENTAGPQGEQALALYIASDHSVLYRCSIAGYQDSLYALALRQFYRECDIYGTIDFIFGNAAAVFQSCNLLLRKPHNYNVILANGRSDPGQTTGFSIQKCRIMASSDYSPVEASSYLGRPWMQYSRSVVMESTIDDHVIAPRGWVEWPGAGSSTLKTLYFAEYSNVGPGAGVSKRVQWPGFHVIGPEEAVNFTVANFIDGTSWLPSTGVTFVPGLH